MAHTKAPWIIGTVRTNDCNIIVRSIDAPESQPITITCLAEVYGNEEEDEANANLIAAAPELLEALEGISDILKNHYGDDRDETPLIDKAFAAIAKATAQ